MCKLYAEPQTPEFGDYWRDGSGWSVYVADGVIAVSDREAQEQDGQLVAVSVSLAETHGAVLATA